MSGLSVALLLWAGLLVLVAGLSAMADAALGAVTEARASALARAAAHGNGRPQSATSDGIPWGAVALRAVAADKAPHRNLLVLIRLACELTATTLVALTVVGWLGLGWLAALVTAGGMTAVAFLFTGVGPRAVGRRHAYLVGRLVAPPLRAVARALGPVSRMLGRIGRPPSEPERGPDPDRYRDMAVELRELVDLAELRGAVEHDEREMIQSVFRLGDTVAREVMVPRTEMVWIEADKTVRQGLDLALRSGFSRIPVIGASVDDVIGVVYLKDLARLAVADPAAGDTVRVEQVMRKAVFVPASKPVDDLLSEMRAARVHLAIVVDEYGGTAGLVTIEDILEEIVGEITDEYDVEIPPVEHLADGSVRVSARLSIEDLGELFGVDLPADEVETVAGLLAQALGRVPIPGATATVGGLRLVAEGTTGRRNRIQTVLVSRADAEAVGGAAAGPGGPRLSTAGSATVSEG